MTREEAILWLQVLKHSQINWVGEQAEDEDIIAKCEEAEQEAFDMAIESLSADAVSREEYTETDGVVTIEKQNANEVGEIKHIVIHSPNYTRYFYNESMPIPNELPKTTDCTNFLLWLLDEIMDEENWELNAVANGEIIARKLKKLGLLEVKDGYYHRIFDENVWVVRCKDCKHYIVDGITTRYGWCHEYKHSVNEDDYCSYGERKK